MSNQTEKTEKHKVSSLKEFVSQHEQAANKKGLVVTKIVHPNASGDIYQGRYAGIRTRKGDPEAVYSDGSKN